MMVMMKMMMGDCDNNHDDDDDRCLDHIMWSGKQNIAYAKLCEKKQNIITLQFKKIRSATSLAGFGDPHGHDLLQLLQLLRLPWSGLHRCLGGDAGHLRGPCH